MKFVHIKVPIEGYTYATPEELSKYDVERLGEGKVTEAYYFYFGSSYEGSGQMLFKADGKWGLLNMGHCSCYGPLEDLQQTKMHDSIDQIVATCSAELKKEISPLVAEAKK